MNEKERGRERGKERKIRREREGDGEAVQRLLQGIGMNKKTYVIPATIISFDLI